MLLRGAQIVMECLLEQGVRDVFGYPGGAVLGIYEALHEYAGRIRHTLMTHEQHAAHAADGYARASGKTGVCLATSGPGATNRLTGLSAAYMDSSPVVAITGNVAKAQIGTDSFQEIDIYGVSMPITKHNFIVGDIGELADTIRQAFFIAASGRPGPVLVDIPQDIAAAKAEFSPKRPKAPVRRLLADALDFAGAASGRCCCWEAARRTPVQKPRPRRWRRRFTRPSFRRSWPRAAATPARSLPGWQGSTARLPQTPCWSSATCSSPWARAFQTAPSPAPRRWRAEPKSCTSILTRRRSTKT